MGAMSDLLTDIAKTKEVPGLLRTGGVGAAGTYARFDVFALVNEQVYVREVKVSAALSDEREVLVAAINEEIEKLRVELEADKALRAANVVPQEKTEEAGPDLTQITGFDTIKGALGYTSQEPPLPSGHARETPKTKRGK